MKEVVDPQANKVLTMQQWNKLLDNLQPITHSKTLGIDKMGKDKWNWNNGNHKKIFDYYKCIGHNTSYWDLAMEE